MSFFFLRDLYNHCGENCSIPHSACLTNYFIILAMKKEKEFKKWKITSCDCLNEVLLIALKVTGNLSGANDSYWRVIDLVCNLC